MGKDYELVRNVLHEDDNNMENIYMKIIDEKTVIEKCLVECDCEGTCDNCEKISPTSPERGKEVVLRNRFKGDESPEALKTSSYDAARGGWVERDPETTQIFRRREQVRRKYELEN